MMTVTWDADPRSVGLPCLTDQPVSYACWLRGLLHASCEALGLGVD